MAVEAHLAALRTHGAPQSRLEAKWQIVRLLYQRGYSREVVRALFRFVDWILTLPEEYDDVFYPRLADFEEVTSMPYITSVERRAMNLGREEGLQEGREEGARQAKRDSVQRIVQARFGALPADLSARLDAVSDAADLDALIATAATAPDLDAFLAALA